MAKTPALSAKAKAERRALAEKKRFALQAVSIAVEKSWQIVDRQRDEVDELKKEYRRIEQEIKQIKPTLRRYQGLIEQQEQAISRLRADIDEAIEQAGPLGVDTSEAVKTTLIQDAVERWKGDPAY